MIIRTVYGTLPNNPYDLCMINGSSLAIFNRDIGSEDLLIDLKDWNVVILSKITSQKNIRIKAGNVFVMNALHAITGKIEIVAQRYINLGAVLHSARPISFKTNEVLDLNISTNYKEWILSRFRQGIHQFDAKPIIKALTRVYDAVINPDLAALNDVEEDVPDDITLYMNTMMFFSIPLTPIA